MPGSTFLEETSPAQGFLLVADCRRHRYDCGMSLPPRLRFLVAEDNEEWQNIIVHILEVDYDLAGVVERGDQIVDTAQKFLPDVVTLDIAMPGQSGLQVLPRLRSMLPNAIIVVISITDTPIYMEEAFARGADGYLKKGGGLLSSLTEIVTSARHRHHQNESDHGRTD